MSGRLWASSGGPRVATLSTSGPTIAWSQLERWEWVVANRITCPNQKKLVMPPETWARQWRDPQRLFKKSLISKFSYKIHFISVGKLFNEKKINNTR